MGGSIYAGTLCAMLLKTAHLDVDRNFLRMVGNYQNAFTVAVLRKVCGICRVIGNFTSPDLCCCLLCWY